MNVSRETQERLEIYLELLLKWSPKINLVSPATLKHASTRHFEDSLQVAAMLPDGTQSWVDMGSGGGFPGAVVAIALADQGVDVTLVESDQRKATFLRTVSRETKTPFKVIAKRIEDIPPLNADVVSARALAPLDILLGFADRHLSENGTALFMKGSDWQNEVADARKKWRFTYEPHNSKTQPNAAVLEIGGLSRV
ncbi:16S rRNA (guanine(527)-N(7))-methyltransferase RsmG [Marivita sp. XM-24bin2]|jgi:16S rRNA (guanine527-N7)-methyltransferase|uniref:16S rRNA (guanine(527)-N(7))-methyltransferase RsmG n=1 Tax=unclassified Marivita TaxID=2632480 RepID=UPI000D7B09C8|nr:16S rRNA (guanine(527)-N(7))-methyltransferase RsmG [Marivita sp. XM-24bin2]MCR9110805.1 16S rRNA (guanine(527)-N(7))-methyltransferase RsmG [Paracoccaceae bacterium]PWL34522.1 MAG: 16S rRNA (guanine(527)-N(7))-methyltransferase RsmG [Marivita sp. XM-24bin2]